LVLLGAAVAVVGGRFVVLRYMAALATLDKRIVTIEKERGVVRQEKMLANEAARIWRNDFGPATLSMNVNQAANYLTEELIDLTRQASLRDVTIGKNQPRTWQKNNVRRLPVTVTGTGRPEDLVGFLFNLHRQPYEVRCVNISIVPAIRSGERKDKKNDQPQAGPRPLKMTAQLETLILPALTLVPSIQPADRDKTKRKFVDRPKGKSMEDYKTMLGKGLFQPYVPPEYALNISTNPPGAGSINLMPSLPRFMTGTEVTLTPAPNANFAFDHWEGDLTGTNIPGRILMEANKTVKAIFKSTGTTAQAPPPPVPLPTAPPEPPPADAEMVIGRILSSPAKQLIVLQPAGAARAPGAPGAPGQPQVAPGGAAMGEYKEIGDQVFGGTLIYVHPRGAVTEKKGERRFHPLGESLKNFVPLTEDDQPDVYHDILKLEQQAASIKSGTMMEATDR